MTPEQMSRVLLELDRAIEQIEPDSIETTVVLSTLKGIICSGNLLGFAQLCKGVSMMEVKWINEM